MMAGFMKTAQPVVPKPVSMPDPEDPALLEKRRREMLEAQRRGGRQSTILSGESGAAPQYSNSGPLGN